MKNDIKQIKNELTNTQTQKQAKEQKKVHQDDLKYNLVTTLQLKFVMGWDYLKILENKDNIIIETLEASKNNKKGEQVQDGFMNLAKNEEQIGAWLTGKEKNQSKIENREEIEDYIYLDEIFFSVYSKFKREEKEKEKLQKEENERKLQKIINNKMEFVLETAKNQTGEAKKRLVLTFKLLEIKAKIIDEIKEIFGEYNAEDISKMYDTVLKELLNKYKYTSESEPEQSKPVKLHWVWKANIALDTINALFKHF